MSAGTTVPAHSNADESDVEWLPEHCPKWCDRGHETAVVETGDWIAAQEHVHCGPGGYLPEIRNAIDKRTTRAGGSGWNLDIRQRPIDARGGYLDDDTVNLIAHDADNKLVTLELTSGEARVLARQLEAMADRIDL
ncbi:MAG TPA: hypothetical protein VNS81_06600 [Nocardioides sp.]|nr:hypothetical protein [Nocardioides sp.]